MPPGPGDTYQGYLPQSDSLTDRIRALQEISDMYAKREEDLASQTAGAGTGLSLGEGLASALVSILPAVLGKAVGGKYGGVYGAKGGAAAGGLFNEIITKEKENKRKDLLTLAPVLSARRQNAENQITKLEEAKAKEAQDLVQDKEKRDDRAASDQRHQEMMLALEGVRGANRLERDEAQHGYRIQENEQKFGQEMSKLRTQQDFTQKLNEIKQDYTIGRDERLFEFKKALDNNQSLNDTQKEVLKFNIDNLSSQRDFEEQQALNEQKFGYDTSLTGQRISSQEKIAKDNRDQNMLNTQAEISSKEKLASQKIASEEKMGQARISSQEKIATGHDASRQLIQKLRSKTEEITPEDQNLLRSQVESVNAVGKKYKVDPIVVPQDLNNEATRDILAKQMDRQLKVIEQARLSARQAMPEATKISNIYAAVKQLGGNIVKNSDGSIGRIPDEKDIDELQKKKTSLKNLTFFANDIITAIKDFGFKNGGIFINPQDPRAQDFLSRLNTSGEMLIEQFGGQTTYAKQGFNKGELERLVRLLQVQANKVLENPTRTGFFPLATTEINKLIRLQKDAREMFVNDAATRGVLFPTKEKQVPSASLADVLHYRGQISGTNLFDGLLESKSAEQ